MDIRTISSGLRSTATAIFVIGSFSLAGCDLFEIDPSGNPSTTTTVDSSGGTARSADGRFTLTFPAGAVTTETEITITRVGVNDLMNPNGGSTQNVAAVYELEPSGLNFAVPVSLSYQSNAGEFETGSIRVPLLFISTESDDGSLEVSEEVTLEANAENMTLTGTTEINHFSRAVIEQAISVAALSFSYPETLVENTTDQLDARFLYRRQLFFDEDETSVTQYSPSFSTQPPFSLSGEIRSDLETSENPGSGDTDITSIREQDLSCNPATNFGEVAVEGEVVAVERNDDPITGDAQFLFLVVPEELTLTTPFKLTGQSRCIGAADPDPGGGSNISVNTPSYTLATGAFDFSASFAALEQIVFFYRALAIVEFNKALNNSLFVGLIGGEPVIARALTSRQKPNNAKIADGLQVAGLPANRPLALLSGRGSTKVLDLGTGQFLQESDLNNADFFGAAVASSGLTAADDVAFVHHGRFAGGGGFPNSGFSEFYFGDDGEFGAFIQLRSSTEFDAQTIGGGLVSEGILVVSGNGVSQLTYAPATSTWPENPTGLDINDLDGGEIVSAYRHTVDGPILVITRGSTDNKLYHYNPVSDSATLIAPLRFDARKLRCKPPICVTSSFGSNAFQASGLDVFIWDGSGMPQAGDSIPLGGFESVAGIVGIDLIENVSQNGDEFTLIETAVVATGFNDGNVYEVRLSPDGTALQTTTTAMPVACENPGHSTWAPDSAGLKFVTSCFTSGNYAISNSLLRFESGAVE